MRMELRGRRIKGRGGSQPVGQATGRVMNRCGSAVRAAVPVEGYLHIRRGPLTVPWCFVAWMMLSGGRFDQAGVEAPP